VVTLTRGESETWRQLPDALAAQDGFDVNRLRVMVGERALVGAVAMGDQTLSPVVQAIVAEHADISQIRQALLEPRARVADILVDFWAQNGRPGADPPQP
jgi:hypothetical protein